MILMGLMGYMIPDIPHLVQQQIDFQQHELKALRMKALNEAYLKKKTKLDRNKTFQYQVIRHETILEENVMGDLV